MSADFEYFNPIRCNRSNAAIALLFWMLWTALTSHALDSPKAPIPILTGPVEVTIYENLDGKNPFDLSSADSLTSYGEPAFGFPFIPTRYTENALPLDRSTPFLLEASYRKNLPPGKYRFRLRAKGWSRFLINRLVILKSKPQRANKSSHDRLPPPPQVDQPGIRIPLPSHQDIIQELELTGGRFEFTLQAVIGGKGLVPFPGELSVSIQRKGEMPRLIGPEDAPELTDADWTIYEEDEKSRHERADIQRRRLLSRGTTAAWDEYHEKVRKEFRTRNEIRPPAISANTPGNNSIDRFIGASLENANLQPTDMISDQAFIRRLSLDVLGRIPTPVEIQAFMKIAPRERREKAVDRIVEQSEWADHWVSYWQDVLAENPGILKPDLNNSGPFRWWLHQSLFDDIPFDRLVAELIQMDGSVLKGGPAGFGLATLNDAPMAAKADIISQAFLAEKLSCARCHDAPDHSHRQIDTFSLAAMLKGKPIPLPSSSTVPLVEGFRKPKVTVSLKPGEIIHPVFPFRQLSPESELSLLIPLSGGVPETRNEVARTIISPSNQRFAQVIANRVWKRYLGIGLVEPAGDWSKAIPSHPDLLKYLAREFILSGYDLKTLAKQILNSHVYQRAPDAGLSVTTPLKERLFAGPMRRRMAAEQLVDSLLLASGKRMDTGELSLNPLGNRPLTQFLNLGYPEKAWEFTALMNERDRPSLSLPVAQSVVDVLSIFGWRQSRQTPTTDRLDAPSPMQSLILANGILGTRMVGLSDQSVFTEIALNTVTLEDLLDRTFMRILSRPPHGSESRIAAEFLENEFPARIRKGSSTPSRRFRTDLRVSWANHFDERASAIRMEEERRLRVGAPPTERLSPEFRERYEDLIWSLFNSPEFVLIP